MQRQRERQRHNIIPYQDQGYASALPVMILHLALTGTKLQKT